MSPAVQEFALTPPQGSYGTSFPLLGFGIFGTLCGAIMIAVVPSPAWTVFFLASTGALFWFSIAWIAVIHGGRRGRIRVIQHEAGLLVPASSAMRVLEGGAPGVFLTATAVSVWQLTNGHGDLRALIGLALLSVIALRPLVRSGRSILTPRAIHLTTGALKVDGAATETLAWGRLSATVFDRKRKAITFTTLDGREVFNPSDLRSDPALVADLINYYCTHPEHRDELGDQRCVQRIRFHQFS